MDKSKILEDVKDNIAIENFREKSKSLEKTKKILESTLTVAICSLSVTGMVFAKDISMKIYDNFFLTGKGMETAMNEGYIENTNMNYENSNTTVENTETGKIIEDTETKVKVDEFVMDDFNLSITFDVELSEKAKEIVTAEEVWRCDFPDLVISDENNVVLYCTTGIRYDEFSKEKKLGLNYDEALDNGMWIGSGVNIVPIEKEGNHVKVVYNIYTGGESNYPKSKKLEIDMNRIRISKNVESEMGDEEISIKGDWNFKVDVPEKMYNRQNVIYKQKSTSNEDFNVQSAVVYNTGMEIKIRFKAEKQRSMSEIASSLSREMEFYMSLDKDDELRNIDILNYIERKVYENPEYQRLAEEEMKKWEFDKYLTNANGERFDFTVGPRANGSAYIDDDGIMTSTCMFDLTQYDATDEVTLHLEYKGNKADIVLEKVN